jgi:CYTH domain-containing protein
VEITQYYINGPEGQARIRSRTWRGVSVFYLTQKRELGPGVRYESERIISATEFANLIRFMEPGTRPVTKLRHTFVWKNQYFELDVFTGFYKGLILLEIELTDKNQKVSIPPFVKKPVEVTSAELFSNYAISKAANVKYYVSCPRR